MVFCLYVLLRESDLEKSRIQLEVLREHRPPPIANIIELWQFFLDPDR